MPDASKMAYLYNPKSPISRPLAEIEVEAKKMGFEIVDCEFTTQDELMTAIQKAVENTNIAFATNDLTAYASEKSVLEFADANNYPIIVGIMRLMGEVSVVAGIQYDWDRAGRICAGKAEQILKGTPANTIPLEFSDQFEIQLNLKVADKLNVAIPYET